MPRAVGRGAKGPRRSSFVGRERERAALEAAIERGRLVTILGPPGAGKSRLALEHVARTPGALVCEVSASSSAETFVAAIASALAIQLAGGKSEAIPSIARALAGRGKTLLVLDDFERVAHAAAETIGRMLDLAPETTFVVTSREALRLDGEIRVDVGSLETDEAARLYAERAGERGVDVSADDPAVRELVMALDGLPLAIELAAARAAIAPPRILLERLSARPLDELRTDRRDARQEHRSLRAAIAVSWELLTPQEADALARCAVFRGGFDVAAAEEVLEGEQPQADLLVALVDRSMLRAEGGRFRLYDAVRSFAAEHGDAARDGRRHAQHYLRAAHAYHAGLHPPDGSAAIRWLDLERDNLLAVHDWGCANDPDVAIGGALALSPLLEMRGLADLHRRVTEAAVAASSRATDADLRAGAYVARGRARAYTGDLDGAREDLEAGLAIAPKSAVRVAALGALGDVMINAGCALPDALRVSEQAVTAAAEAGDARLEAWARFVRQWQLAISDVPAAQASLARALKLLRAKDDRSDVLRAALLGQRGYLTQLGGMHSEAIADLEHATAAMRKAGYRRRESTLLLCLAQAYLETGEVDAGVRVLEDVIRVCREIDYPANHAPSCIELGGAAWARGDLALAERAFHEARDVAERMGSRRLLGLAHECLAALRAREGREAESERHAAEALRCFEVVDDPHTREAANLLRGLREIGNAKAAAARGDRAQETSLLESARARSASVTLPLDDALMPARLLRAELSAIDRGLRVLKVGREGRWLEIGGQRSDLSKRSAPRRVLDALAERRLASAGSPLTRDELIEIGWPGERMLHEAAVMRLHQCIRVLRDIGLEGVLVTRDDGYLLDTAIDVQRDV
jgi:predicted ATPase